MKGMRATIVAIVLGTAASTVLAGASPRMEVTGRVVDATGAPAPGAVVTARAESGHTVTVYSAPDGGFHLPARTSDPFLTVGARLPGVGAVSGPIEGELELTLGPDTVPAPGASWLAGLPDGETTRRFILDCTGCHVTDDTRIHQNGAPRDEVGWRAGVAQMVGQFGPNTGFPIISSWARPETLAPWLTRHLSPAQPVTPRIAGPAGSGVVLTEYPFPVPQDLPHDLAVDERGQVVVTGMFSHAMWTLDPRTGDWDRTPIPVPGANPRAVDIDVLGRWWVVLGGPGRVAIHDPASGEWQDLAVGMYAHSIALDSAGRGWVNGHFTHQPEVVASIEDVLERVERYEIPPDPDGSDTETTIPYGLRAAPDGTIWGTQLRGNRLLRLDPGTGDVGQWELPITHSGPRRPDVAPDGSIWIPLYSANALARFDPGTESFHVWDFPVPGALPYVARAHPGDGTVWIGTGHGDVVASFDPRAEEFTLYPLPTRGALIRHLDVDPERNEVWFAYGASPGIPGRILRLEIG